MSLTPYIYDGGLLSAVAAVQGAAVPALAKRLIKAATLTNTTGAPIAATIYLVPSGSVPGPANTYISARPIAPGESYTCPELINQGVSAAGSIQALGNGLTFKFTAVDIV